MENYIKAICFTNLDDYNCREANLFCAVPNIGDKVRVIRKGHTVYLRVVSIYHEQSGDKPFLRIELHN